MKTFLSLLAVLAAFTVHAADKKIVLIAGRTSHGPGDHEFRAGCLLLQKCLDQTPGVTSVVYSNGWPHVANAFDGADAVLIFADGGAGHPLLQGDHLKVMAELVKRGVGLGCAHFGVEIPSTNGGPQLLEWIGGYYEDHYSVNPMWEPDYQTFTEHPVTRGVKPFKLRDEWSFNMRWPADVKGVTHILVAKPSDKIRNGPYVYPAGPYKHIQDAKDRAETMMWVFERPDGGRGFGFTGGHRHVNWANENFRKVVLNALLWIAKADVPANGVASTVAPTELGLNLDAKGAPTDAVNLTGKWNFEVETPNGTGKPVMTFVHAGNNVNGHYTGRFGDTDFPGSVKGADAQWSFTVDFNGEPATVIYKGKIEGKDNMKGTATFGDIEATWTAKRE